MKVNPVAVTVSGNVDTGRRKPMTVHAEAFGKMMSMFSNQYSNAALAVVREYFCNGDDARIAAGSDRPTEVFLPTELNPVLLVRDFGIGLDTEGLEVTFATYLLSTKDQADDQTGGFGIGSKAAFTLGQQFTVTGFKDGQRTTMLVALDERGEAYTDILFEGPTDEPNGVLIEIGVPDIAKMVRAANDYFLTVPKGRALVDGVEPAHLFDTVEVTRFNDEVVKVQDGKGQIRVQMGPVVYPVSRDILLAVADRLGELPSAATARALASWDSSDTVLLEVGMSEVQIAPSREDLRDTEATINRLAASVQGIYDHIYTGIQAKVDAAASQFQAAHILRDELAGLKGFKVSKKGFTWNGQEKAFKTEVVVEHPVLFMTTSYGSRGGSRKVVGRENKHTVDFSRMDRTLVVTGVGPDEVSKVSRYAKRFFEARIDVEWIVVTPETSGQVEWFEFGTPTGALTMSLDEYRAALRSLRDSDPRRLSEPSYTSTWNGKAERDLDDRDLLSDIVAEGKPIVIFHESVYVGDSKARQILEQHYTPVVLLPQQSVNALRKRVEKDGSVEVFEGNWREVVATQIKAEVAAPTDDERVSLGAYNWLRNNRHERTNNWASRLLTEGGEEAGARINHPAIQDVQDTFDLAALVAEDLTTERREALSRLATWAGVAFEPIEFEAGRVAEMKTVFPLFENGIDWWDYRRTEAYRDAVIEYINSKA